MSWKLGVVKSQRRAYDESWEPFGAESQIWEHDWGDAVARIEKRLRDFSHALPEKDVLLHFTFEIRYFISEKQD